MAYEQRVSAEAVDSVFDESNAGLAPPAPVASVKIGVKGGRKKEAGPSPELCFVQQMNTDLGSYRIGGLLSDFEGYDKTFYRWTEGEGGSYWQAIKDEVLEAKALDYLAGKFSDAYSKRRACSLVDTLKASWITDEKSALKKPSEPVIIPCLDDYLAINRAGDIRRLPADKLWGATFCVRAKLDLGKLKETEEEEYIPKELPEGSIFKSFIEEIMPDVEVRAVLQEALGSTLLTKNFQKAIWLQGGGGNGKSTILSIMQAFHSKWTSFNLEQLDNRFGLSSLVGASLVCVPETPKGAFNEQEFKKLVGRDVVSYECKGKDFSSFKPQAVWLLAMNTPPAVRDHTDGFWRRILPIPFTVQIPENKRVMDFEKKMIEDKAEMKAILDWLLIGAVRLHKRGSFLADKDMPKAIRDATKTQRSGTDSVLAFLEDHPIIQDTKTEYTNQLSNKVAVYQTYQEFCEQSGKHAQNISNFWERIRDYIRKTEGREIEERQLRDNQGKRSRFVDVAFDGITSKKVHITPFDTP